MECIWPGRRSPRASMGPPENSNSVLRETDSRGDVPYLEPDLVAEGSGFCTIVGDGKNARRRAIKTRHQSCLQLWETPENWPNHRPKFRIRIPRSIGLRRNLPSWRPVGVRHSCISRKLELAFPGSITVERARSDVAGRGRTAMPSGKCEVKEAPRQGTRGTARSRLRSTSASGKCKASLGSARVSVMRMDLAAG